MSEPVSAGENYKAFADALVKASTEMPALNKADENKHGGFRYVSIDNYYETVARIALKHGFTWKIRETESGVIPIGTKLDRNGHETAIFAVRSAYTFDVMHAPSGTVWGNYFSCSIVHPLQGAQTAGSAMSYADKLFMRTTFHVVTGEQDADATDSRAFEPADAFDMSTKPTPKIKTPTPKAANADGDVWQLFGAAARTFVDNAADEKALKDYWVSNEQTFTEYKQTDPVGYEDLVRKFTARKRELKEKKVG